MQPDDGPVGQLEERLRRYPAERYPVQHATAQFHLGVALADLGELDGAEAALVRAAELFDPRALSSEHGKALNALGSVLRMAGRPEQAAKVFLRAAAAFQAADVPGERGAACFNLGLVRREMDDIQGATAVFAEARRLFEEGNAPAYAAAAARELGGVRFAAGDLDAAREVLEQSVDLAARAGDEAGAGAAANVLGLVELAAGRPREAVDAFAVAAAAHPRGVRREEHAMAKANLALALEAAGEQRSARIAVRQALGVRSAPAAVRAQAEAALGRLGAEADDVVAVVEEEQDSGARIAIVREELARWLDARDAERPAEAGAWIDAQLARPAASVALAEAWVGGLLELPPADLRAVIRSVVEALRERPADAQESFRSDVARAAARFHVPQLLRLRDEFNRMAVELGEQPVWR